MKELSLRARGECRFDLVSLGEVMLRLDPGTGRVATARRFDVWEGGGEYNVARGMRRCFGLPTAVVTALADNPVGRLVEDLMLTGGVDTSHVLWVPFDGVGRAARNGLNFTERGFGVRGAVGCSDRGHTAVSQLRPGQIDWDAILGREGARWLHCGGIFCALSETTAEVAREAFEAARRHGTVVSYDLNYRASLWASIGGHARAAEVNRELVSLVDVVVGNEEDYQLALGYEVEGVDEALTSLDRQAFLRMLDEVAGAYPNLALLAVTLRACTRPRGTAGGRSASPRAVRTRRPTARSSRSSTGSAAATRSPPASSTACSRGSAPAVRSSSARRTERSR